MKITKEDLRNRDIDPSLYSPEDMEMIENFADRILGGELPVLLKKLSLRAPDEQELKDKITECRQNTAECIKKLISLLDVIYELCSQRQGIFAAPPSPEETERIVCGAASIIDEMFDVKDKALDHITLMFNYKISLSRIRGEYNTRLYEAGLLNAAFAVACPDGDNSDILELLGNTFEMFNELTEIANDVNDRVIIFDESLNFKLGKYWCDMTEQLDLDGDGARLDTRAVKSTIEAAKQLLKDVIER